MTGFMKETTAKEQMLKRVRNALIQKNENPYFNVKAVNSYYQPGNHVHEIAFAEALNNVLGSFIYCTDEYEMLMQFATLKHQRQWDDVYVPCNDLAALFETAAIPVVKDTKELKQMSVGVTRCEALVARLGSVLISSAVSGGRRMNVYPDVHVVIAFASQVVPDLQEAIALLTKRYGDQLPSFISFITGPSRTADIEKTLVMGAHGPKELIVFMIDDINVTE